MEIKKQCQYCGCSFIAHKMTTIYCSASCNNKDYKSKIREKQIAEYQAQHPTPSPRVVKPTSTAKEFLTPTEGAKLLGISRATFYRNMREGTIKAVQMRGKTIIRRKDIEFLFDNPPEYKTRSLDPKMKQKHEYYTMRQIEEKFKCSKKAIRTRIEKFNIPKIYQGRNTYFDKALVDLHFAELIAEFDRRDYYTIDQLEEKFQMSHQAVLSFVQRNKIPRITQGRSVYYSKVHVDTFKGEREKVDPNYYTYSEIMEKYSFSKDQVSYYIHNYDIPNHKHGRFTLVERMVFDRIIKERMETNSLAKEKERREQQPKTCVVPEGYLSVAQIAEKYGVSQKHVTAKTREGKVPKLVIKHFNYYNEEAIEALFNRDSEKFEVPEDYITAEQVAKRFKVTVHYVHNRTRTANTPKITVKHVNFYELKAIEALFGKNEASLELQGDETAEWLTGEQVDQVLNSTVVARRTFVSRHKIPNKKEYGITYYCLCLWSQRNNAPIVVRENTDGFTFKSRMEDLFHRTEERVAVNERVHLFVMWLVNDVGNCSPDTESIIFSNLYLRIIGIGRYQPSYSITFLKTLQSVFAVQFTDSDLTWRRIAIALIHDDNVTRIDVGIYH